MDERVSGTSEYDPLSPTWGRQEHRRTLMTYGLCGSVTVLALAVLLVAIASINESSLLFRNKNKEEASLSAVLANYSTVPAEKECSATNPLEYVPFYSGDSGNQQGYGARITNSSPILLKNGSFITMQPNGTYAGIFVGDLLIDTSGLIASLAASITNLPAGTVVVNLSGAFVTPGLVDAHSHSGVYSYPDGSFGTADGNEMTNPSLSQIRAFDAFDAEDPAIPLIRGGGVTTALVLPGSGDVMGGQAQVVKYRTVTPTRPSELFVTGARRGAKFACGENPKRVFGGKGVLPMSRMGVGYELRRKFYEAASMNQKQSQWDCQNLTGDVTDPRPFSLELETLQSILKGDVDLHNHCYEVQDIMMMLRTASEFNFQIRCFHHGLEAWKIAKEIASHGAYVATFADHWGFKMEAYDGSVHGPKVLYEGGVKVILKSDHPVIPAWHLVNEAAKSNHWGLPDMEALAAITRTPAEAIGLSDRVGTIQVGKDADLVVWDRYPLEIGAQTTSVYVEGIKLVDTPRLIVPRSVVTQASLQKSDLCSQNPGIAQTASCYVITGATVYTQDGTTTGESKDVLVQNGMLTCIDSPCVVPPGCRSILYPQGILVPGFVQVGTQLGLVEVSSESLSQDGTLSDPDQRNLRAIDGVRLNNFKGRHLAAAFAGGVTTHIVHSQSSALIRGQSGAYYTQARVVYDAIIADVVSLDINLGQSAKTGGSSNSISSQIYQLRKIFTTAANAIAANTSDPTDPVVMSLKHVIPVVLHCHNADEISHFIRIQEQFGFDMIVYGGAEAYLIGDLLASHSIPVILSPGRLPPTTFSTWNTLENAAATLESQGVTVAIASDNMGDVRNLRWDAGIQGARGFKNGLASVTNIPAKLFGLDSQGIGVLRVGTKAAFSAFSADPLTYFGAIQLIGLGDSVTCFPQQY